MTNAPDPDAVARAAEALRAATAIVFASGAGMGVDSGLPDYRGTEGFYRAYPPYAKAGLSYTSIATPKWFTLDPTLIWGYLGHRIDLYRSTAPHEGYAIVRRWCERAPGGHFTVTSNIDNQLQRAGFAEERVFEGHGSLFWAQCQRACGVGVYAAHDARIPWDESTLRATGPAPLCPACGAPSRPNVLFFGDSGFDASRSEAQYARLRAWLDRAMSGPGARLVVVECGAGTGVPNVRNFSELEARRFGGTLVRINPREPAVPAGHVGIASVALAALRAIDARLGA
ncbi:MAG TPA: Sir2 family NAD-dependent protein deacetylase [Polyangiaceae bacterium]|nr:Sir2 family NAD-dependent protein deacetylase [Polyangiaceae bacterium]